jgi:hypothetical protein
MRSTKNRPVIDRSIAIDTLDMPGVEHAIFFFIITTIYYYYYYYHHLNSHRLINGIYIGIVLGLVFVL